MNAAAEPIAADDKADERYMRLALALGRRGLGQTAPNPAVGAVIVKDGVILGRGWTQAGGRPHAETQALKRAGKAAEGATLYATLEPCSHKGRTPPCADAIVRAGIARVVSALVDPNPEVAGAGHFRMAEKGIQVEVGLCADEAKRMHAGHIRRVTEGRPNVLLKLAVSVDGKAGLPGRRPIAITGEAARERVFQMRAENDAILVGIGTVLADDPSLTCRLPGMFERSPTRIVLDAGLKVPLASQVIATVRDTPSWVFAARSASAMGQEILEQRGAQVFRVDDDNGRLDLGAVLKVLAEEGITRLMVEGGPRVATSFIETDLVDEVALFRSPKELGAGAIDVLDSMSLDALTQSPRLRALTSAAFGDDRLDLFERA
jgi:diaminohydroxyphosphoribosylaminopyrimidine deaminase/5-amino-6-(5-phosphoribosylamino)uracil reductase